MNALVSFSTPQLTCLHRGKVRDSFRVAGGQRLLVASDRLSAFDHVLDTAIPGKGAVLNRLSAFWFDKMRDIVPNHMIRSVADRAMLVEDVDPIRVEVIVRGFLAGSAWRAYAAGTRSISGQSLPNGLTKNQQLPSPIVTPTTKGVHDSEISPDAIVERGLATQEEVSAMIDAAQRLFAHASTHLLEAGLLLVDTKYEFGRKNGLLILIDELHTPDSSRFWSADEYARDPESAQSWDKEYVRQWLLERQADGETPFVLPRDVVAETKRRYAELLERVTGLPAAEPPDDAADHFVGQLVGAGLLKDAFVAVVLGSASDREHAAQLTEHLEPYDVAVIQRIVSAHKTPRAVADLCDEFNAATEPGAVVAVAGLSNGLGGALAANTALPVINCPPFSDRLDFLLNINSSLMMPSHAPAMTVVHPKNAALAAARCLNLRRLRGLICDEIAAVHEAVARADEALRGGEDGD